jgi:Sec-independent protein secretion pathway component TatC
LLLSLPFVALASWALASPRSFETAKKSFPFFVAGSYVGELVALLLGQFVLLPALLHAQPGPFEPIRLSDYVALVFRVIAGTSMVFELAVVAAFVAFHRGATNSTTLDEPTSSARAKNTPR